jgi:hypothetical protein
MPDRNTRRNDVKRGIILGLAGALAIAIPAAAKTHPTGTHGSSGTHPTQSHKCTAHSVGYTAYGKLVSWSLTKNTNGSYSGSLVVSVTKANHHAKGAKGSSVTYTVTNAHVTLGHGVTTPPAAGSKVKLIGKITTVTKKCPYAIGTTTIRKIVVHAPAK